MHSVPKDEQSGNDSSRTSIVSNLGMFLEVASILHVNLNHCQEFRLNSKRANFEELINSTDYLRGHSLPINFVVGSALGPAYLPHITE